jgi:hypothetical protein
LQVCGRWENDPVVGAGLGWQRFRKPTSTRQSRLSPGGLAVVADREVAKMLSDSVEMGWTDGWQWDRLGGVEASAFAQMLPPTPRQLRWTSRRDKCAVAPKLRDRARDAYHKYARVLRERRRCGSPAFAAKLPPSLGSYGGTRRPGKPTRGALAWA